MAASYLPLLQADRLTRKHWLSSTRKLRPAGKADKHAWAPQALCESLRLFTSASAHSQWAPAP